MGRGTHIPPPVMGDDFFGSLEEGLEATLFQARENLHWLRRSLHPYFFITMADERDALLTLAAGLHTLAPGTPLVLAESAHRTVIATLSTPGSFYTSLRGREDRGLAYVEVSHSTGTVPGTGLPLELQRLEFRSAPARTAAPADLPEKRLAAVRKAFGRLYPDADATALEKDAGLVATSNPRYARISPPERMARAIWLLRQAQLHNGLFFGAEQSLDFRRHRETRLLFAVGNPPLKGFASQALEVLNRLRVGVRRAYGLFVDTAEGPFFLGTFYVRKRGGQSLHRVTPLFAKLKSELYNTQIISTTSRPYRTFVTGGLMSGEDASLVNAFTAFCFTTLGHSDPDRFGHQEVAQAFTANPDLSRLLCRLFRIRFDPARKGRQRAWERTLPGAQRAVESYNTGHRHLDGMRRAVYRTALLFIRRCLKTNFFVPEKHALSFRLDPAYLDELDGEFTSDLPPATPFRVTFFCGRHGAGYHVGFADIARGGWRTVVCADEDDYNENMGTVFREAFVLAHTQHLKNKDIYEGGSKLVAVLDDSDISPGAARLHRLHALQYGFVNALFDICSTLGGGLGHGRVVDYFGDAEAIELGPDENMDDSMIELIARQAVRRGYLLGRGVISSKRVGISHRRWGVTSLGVVTFAAAALRELGTDIYSDSFTVKLTGGPKGDVAGNTIRILLERCPKVRLTLVADGSGALFDPGGIDGGELRRLLLSQSIDAFDPGRIGPGGFLLCRRRSRMEDTRILYLRQRRLKRGLRKEWVTADEMNEQFEDLPFSVEADLFVPAGGRPETVNDENWRRFLREGGATCRAVVEGANSFLTPGARKGLQEAGVLVIRDASANKCGVISSSYEIIANLLMSDEEFLACEKKYVADVLAILARRAGDEADLIFRRRRESGGTLLCTEISDSLSGEINSLYDRIFSLLTGQPELLRRPSFRRALLAHLPALVTGRPNLRRRIGRLPLKYRCAMTASELAAAIVYSGGMHDDFGHDLEDWVAARFGG